VATWAERQKAPEQGQVDYLPDGSGLKLRVFASGKRCWFVRGRIRQADGQGQQRFVVLGDAAVMTREEAAAEAANARMLMRRGVDPVAARDAKLKAADAGRKTFLDVANEWSEVRIASGKWSEDTIATRRAVFNGPRLAALSDKLIGQITARDIEAAAARIAANSMQAALGPVRTVLKYAVQQGYIAASPFATSDVQIRKAAGNAEPLIEFHEGREPDFSEFVAVLDAIRAAEQQMPLSPWWGIWRVCLATGARPSAIIGLRWSELQLEGAPSWHLPVSRSKIKQASAIPLSEDCASILRNVPRVGDLVWPGRDGKSKLSYPPVEPKFLSTLLSAAGYPKGWKPGRARDSVASWLEFQPDATERAMALLLNHKPPADNTRRQHYARISAEHQARALIERYAQAVQKAIKGEHSDDRKVEALPDQP
jgi:integrase